MDTNNSNWVREKLNIACTFKSGKTISKDIEKQLAEILYVKVGDMNLNGNEEFITTSSRFVDKNTIKENDIIPVGAVIFPKRGGAIATNKKRKIIKPTIVDLNTMAVIPTNKLLSDLLYYWFFSFDLVDISNGTSIPQINNNSFDNVFINYPKSLTEQKQIVALLDQAFKAIDQAQQNIEKNIANAKELFQSKLNAIFSQTGEDWEERTLGDLGTLTSSKRIFKKEYVAEGVPFYRSKEIKELGNNRDITLELFIAEERYEEIKEKFGVPQAGDILLTAVGTIGEMYIVKDNERFYFKDGNIMWLKQFDTLNPYYLKYALTNFVEQLKAISRGSAYSALTIEKLKAYSIPVPNIEEQKGIVKSLNNLIKETKNQEYIYTKKLNNLEELKRSILQKAFNGELT